MSFEKCIAAIKQAAGKDLSDAELERLLDRLVRRQAALRARAGGTLSDAEALHQAAQQLGDEDRAAAAIQKRNALLNLATRTQRRARVLAAPNPVDGLKTEIHGI